MGMKLMIDVSMCPYNQTDTHFHGFLGTHQPAIWMGMSIYPAVWVLDEHVDE
jgi:hypothetical protein